jgi:DNA topoisomerase-3
MGHMYELQPPEFYHSKWKSWRIEDLPILPDRFERKEASEDYQIKQLAIVRGLLKNAQTVVNVGDAGREGQLLIDELLQEMKWDPFGPKTQRLWLQNLVEKDIIAAMNKMFPNKDKLALYEAAFERQTADWMHGLTLTRFYTVKARMSGATSTLTVGRVQTPTLKLVVDRDRTIEGFKPVKHYRPCGFFRHDNGTFKADWMIPDDYEGLDPDGRLIDKKVADSVAEKIMGKPGKITDFATTKKSKSPPLPYTLDSLTKACTTKFGMTADEVAAVMQKLYEEHKIVSYPRTDCEFLPTAILKEDAPTIMAALKGAPQTDRIAANANMSIRSSAWNDSKITDHYGIIPTTAFSAAKYAKLDQAEKNVFDLIATRFIAQFYPDQAWNSTSVTVTVEGLKFKATGRIPLQAGWTAVMNTSEEGDEPDPDQEADQSIPEMKKGDTVVADKTIITDSTTKPPAYFNDGTLMEAMKYVYRFVTNPEIKKRLKDGGLGTSATRGNIIKNLLSRGYFKRKGKTGIVSTEQGRAIIDAVPESVSSPELTAIWEQQLARIERGEASAQQFNQAIRKSVSDLIDKIRNTDITIKGQTIKPLPGHGTTCPSCGKGTLITRQIILKKDKSKKVILSCTANDQNDPNSCKYVDWGDGPKVVVEPLPDHGKSCPKCGKGKMLTRMISKGEHQGKRFLSCDQWSKDDPKSCSHSEGLPERPKPSETMEGDGTTCPKCKKGTLRTRQAKSGKVFLACDNWRAGDKKSCDHVVWGEDKVEALEGHGVKCEKCGTGVMMTRSGKGGRFLSCNSYPKCDNAVFPDDYQRASKPSGGGGFSKGKTFGSKAPAGKPASSGPGAPRRPPSRST